MIATRTARKACRRLLVTALLVLTAALVGCGGEDSPPVYEPAVPPVGAPLAGEGNPFIGTAGDGQTYPGASLPWSLASPSPHTTLTDPLSGLMGIFANGGYLHGEPLLYGFGQTHLSGVGCPDLGAPVVVPTVGALQTRWENYGAQYADEHAYAGYYAVTLQDP